ncbi:MAG: ATP-binding protein [Ignavibacteria bacterium]|nr:ATP-binding protein [Ignavibacteria bacterium]
MNIEFKGKYKSIENFVWNDIPRFAVITGKNGTGKSQLLRLIHCSITKNWDIQMDNVEHSIIDEFFRIEDIIFLQADSWGLQEMEVIGTHNIEQEREGLYLDFVNHVREIKKYKDFGTYKKSKVNDINYLSKLDFFDEYYEKKGFIELEDISKQDLLENVYSKILMRKNQMRNQRTSTMFYEYKLKLVEAKSKGDSEEQFIHLNSKKPWEVINSIFKEINLPFAISNPEDVSILDRYVPQLINIDKNVSIKFTDLSSGERVLVSLVFWLFNSDKYNVFPKLLLLDEPDAHLHPAMTKQLIKVLKEVLVEKYNVRVIMTTHSPSTVALTPDENLYEMIFEEPRIIKSSDKKKTISQLTEGIVIVSEAIKYILIEGKDDKDFYEKVFRSLIGKGLITPEVPLAFISGTNKDSVNHWSNGLRAAGLSEIVKGVIDKDNGNEVSEGIYSLKRYSIENYLLDPILIFSYQRNIPETLNHIDYKQGEEEKLSVLNEAILQLIADEVLKVIEEKLVNLTDEEKVKIEIQYCNGKSVKLPKWFINRRGKDLRQIFQDKFGSPSVINNPNLLLSFTRIGLIPKDLQELYLELQK